MQSISSRIGNAITSLSTVTFALTLNTVAMIFSFQAVLYDTLPTTMVLWERELVSWIISCSLQVTFVVAACNAELLFGERTPLAIAICTGLLFLIFIGAFEPDIAIAELLRRWSIGCFVASVSALICKLFSQKWRESNANKALAQTVIDLAAEISDKDSELKYSKAKINELDTKLLEATDYVMELEAFKESELKNRTCENCGETFVCANWLASHRATCIQASKYGPNAVVNDK